MPYVKPLGDPDIVGRYCPSQFPGDRCFPDRSHAVIGYIRFRFSGSSHSGFHQLIPHRLVELLQIGTIPNNIRMLLTQILLQSFPIRLLANEPALAILFASLLR